MPTSIMGERKDSDLVPGHFRYYVETGFSKKSIFLRELASRGLPPLHYCRYGSEVPDDH